MILIWSFNSTFILFIWLGCSRNSCLLFHSLCLLCAHLLHSICSFALWVPKQLIFIQSYCFSRCANAHVSCTFICVSMCILRSTWPISFFSMHIFTLLQVDELLNRHTTCWIEVNIGQIDFHDARNAARNFPVHWCLWSLSENALFIGVCMTWRQSEMSNSQTRQRNAFLTLHIDRSFTSTK